ncbi:hypothetical protein OUZ56_005513 [Daphnia magna]|uniref:Uncharacterized protein n=1 Tax=Daphnia magna TaxID=35525 RepID=A0ABQ9YSZ6_9CRUS|nr:hypothetical protein OUZ56_005513 [Daphnia magna]
MPDEFTHIAPSQAEDRIKDRSSTASTEKPESDEVFIELEIDDGGSSLMDIIDDLSTELKKLTVSDLDTQEELKEVEHDATNDLQGVYETTGNVIPCYLDLLNKVSVTIKDSNGKLYNNPACPFSSQIKYCKPIASVLKESLTRRLSYVLRVTFYVLGTMLNPMFKKKWIF